jgi:dinuclear metal center YbgI/SA1388 family protein
MKPLRDLTAYLDQFLRTAAISDYSQSMNGLHLENQGKVTKVAVAVDACEAVITKACEGGADLLIVHHGLFWNQSTLTTGMYRKIRLAIAHNLAIYSSHLPLDVHPVVGNNVILAKSLGLKKQSPFLPLKGQPAGLAGEFSGTLLDLVKRVRKAVGGDVHVCAGGPSRVKRVGVVTGGAGSEIAAVAASGVDNFVTGEGPHWSYTLAEELGINVIYAGHYATETFGVKALAQHLSVKFRLPWSFIDHPTGL